VVAIETQHIRWVFLFPRRISSRWNGHRPIGTFVVLENWFSVSISGVGILSASMRFVPADAGPGPAGIQHSIQGSLFSLCAVLRHA